MSPVRLSLRQIVLFLVATQLAGRGLASSTPEEGPSSPSVSVESIAEAWRNRQQAVKSFHFEWDEKYTLTADAASALSKGRSNEGAETHETSFFVTMDGDKLRYFQDSVSGSPKGMVRQKKDVSSVGEVYKHLFHANDVRKAQGEIQQSGANHSHVDDPTLLPLAMTVRPFSKLVTVFDNLTTRFEIDPEEQTLVNGRECLRLSESPTDGSRERTSLWVDPERDFVITRRTVEFDGHPIVQFDLTEFQQVGDVWIPVGWTINFLKPDGSTFISRVGNVTDYEINQAIDESAFELEFPEGIYVYDARTSSDNRVDLEIREAAAADENRSNWLLVANLVLLVVVLGTLAVWKLRRNVAH